MDAQPRRTTGRGRTDGWLPVVAWLLLATGCGGDGVPRTAIPDSAYVEVMARMVLVDSAMTSRPDVSLGGISRDSARRLVLARYGVTPDELLDYARTVGEHPRAMAGIWQRIQERADSLEAGGWSPADGETAPDLEADSGGRDAAPDEARGDSSP